VEGIAGVEADPGPVRYLATLTGAATRRSYDVHSMLHIVALRHVMQR
jgi:hypothetical protein